MPPKKTPATGTKSKITKVPKTAVPEIDPQPLNDFLESFDNLLKKWFDDSPITPELVVHILKDGKYIEETPEEVIIEQPTDEIDMTVKYDVPPTPEKEFSNELTEDELMNLRLEDCNGTELPESGKVNIGLGFNHEGILSKLQVEDAKLPPRFVEILRIIKCRYVTITKLHLINCKLQGNDIVELGLFLIDHNSVNDVNLDHNPVHDQNFHLLIRQTGVEHLSLRHCKINCFGAKMISRALKFEYGVVRSLLTLNLNGNMIHDEGFIVLAQSLRCNCTLQCLSVSKNIISDYGVVEFSKILHKFPLTRYEDLDRKFSYIKYLESIEAKGLLNSTDNTSIVTNISSISNLKNYSSRQKRKKKTLKMISTENKEDFSDLATASDATMFDVFTSNLHPFFATTFAEDGVRYCFGNFSLRYVNLSYNWFGIAGLKALINGVEYQVTTGPQKNGPGLMYVELEGLYFDGLESEVAKLKEILAQRYIPPSLDKRHLFV